MVAIFFRRLFRGEPIRVNACVTAGDEGCERDYVFVQDAVRANLAAFEGALDGRTINVATGTATTTRALAEHIVRLVDQPAIVDDAPHRPGDLRRSALDPAVMVSMLGEPTPLDRGLKNTADWFRQEALAS